MLRPSPYPASAPEEYSKRRDRFAREVAELEESSTRYSNFRLAVFLVTIIAPIVAYNSGYLLTAGIALLTGGVLFIALLIRHGIIIDQLEAAKRLLEINREGLERIAGNWTKRKHQGAQFLDRSHPYATDLDVFGPNSLFQWICAAHSPRGHARLAELLSRPIPFSDLALQQKAIEELAGKLDWRQRLEQSAMNMEEQEWDPLLKWGESNTMPWFQSGIAKWVRFLPFVTLLTGSTAYFMGAGIFPLALLLTVQMVLAAGMARSLQPHIKIMEKQQVALGALESSLMLVEQEEFATELNLKLKAAIAKPDYSAGSEIGTLRATAGWLQMRNNPPVHFVLSVLSLWDLQWVSRTEGWRQRNGGRIRGWISSLTEFEALGSLAIIPFENPEWPFPEVALNRTEPLDAVDMGHPLLAKNVRVTNSFRIEHPGMVGLITGSNMSGKSTFLRSVGVNLVLAYAGVPVCAREFACSYMPLYTSMRVTDDLGTGVSSFYAELLRVKMIIEASRREPIFFLIDEIFRGTNSRDRLSGSKEVLKTLAAANATGLVSTHDLELSKLTEEQPERFRNYHFSEHYSEDGIVFEYRLQPGESRTTNAVYLMKQLGIMPS